DPVERSRLMLRATVLLCLLVLCGPLAAPREARSAPPERTPTSAAPSKVAAAPRAQPEPDESIRVPDVARRAEEVGRLLRDIDRLVVRSYFIEAIEKQLPDIAGRIGRHREDTNRQLEAGPSAVILDGLAAQWDAVRAEMDGYVKMLAERA